MRRLVPLRLLIALLAFIGLANDVASKVVHGEVHLGESATLSAAERVVHAVTPGVEAHEAASDHSELHATTVAPQWDTQAALPAHEVAVVPASQLLAAPSSPRTVTNKARPPNADGRPAQPRAPPIG